MAAENSSKADEAELFMLNLAKRLLFWPLLAMILPAAQLLGFTLWEALFPIDGEKIGWLEIVGGVFSYLSFGLLFAWVPAIPFVVYAIVFEALQHKVKRNKITNKWAIFWLVLLAIVNGYVIAIMLNGDLSNIWDQLKNWVYFVQGPMLFGLVPAIVASIKIYRTENFK